MNAEIEQQDQRTFTSDWFSRHIPNWMEWLAPLKGQPVNLLEIGSYEGRSACWLLDNILTHPASRLVCIDIWEGQLWEQWLANVGIKNHIFDIDHERVLPLQGRSAGRLAALVYWEKLRFDFIYVDGSHRAADVLADGVLAWELLKPGGLLLFDDYCWMLEPAPENRPAMAIDAFMACHVADAEVLHKGYQVLLRKRL